MFLIKVTTERGQAIILITCTNGIRVTLLPAHAFYLISLVAFFSDVLMLHKHRRNRCMHTHTHTKKKQHMTGIIKSDTHKHTQYPSALQLILMVAGEKAAS